MCKLEAWWNQLSGSSNGDDFVTAFMGERKIVGNISRGRTVANDKDAVDATAKLEKQSAHKAEHLAPEYELEEGTK